MGVAPVILHNREGRGTDNIKKTYDEISTPGLAAFKGRSPQGTWTLVVQDKERLDTGKIRSFTLELRF
jgi:subtilisin-like proprotein convertase family protein